MSSKAPDRRHQMILRQQRVSLSPENGMITNRNMTEEEKDFYNVYLSDRGSGTIIKIPYNNDTHEELEKQFKGDDSIIFPTACAVCSEIHKSSVMRNEDKNQHSIMVSFPGLHYLFLV